MRIYLDNCAFNRPFDDQSQIRIKIETEAKLFFQEEVEAGRFELVWSYVNESENLRNPIPENKAAILRWKKIATFIVYESNKILGNAEKLLN